MSQAQQPGVGHNSGQPPAPKTADSLGDNPGTAERQHAVDRLRSIVDRIERLEEEKKALASDIRDIYHEAKSAGFDVKVLDVYRRALGM